MFDEGLNSIDILIVEQGIYLVPQDGCHQHRVLSHIEWGHRRIDGVTGDARDATGTFASQYRDDDAQVGVILPSPPTHIIDSILELDLILAVEASLPDVLLPRRAPLVVFLSPARDINAHGFGNICVIKVVHLLIRAPVSFLIVRHCHVALGVCAVSCPHHPFDPAFP